MAIYYVVDLPNSLYVPKIILTIQNKKDKIPGADLCAWT